MVVSSHQPNFLPYMGVFYKAAKCDVLVLSDDVQFSKKGMHNWNRIKTPTGEAKLTLPVHAHHDMALADVPVVDPQYSVDKLVKTIEQNYRKARHYEEGMVILDAMKRESTKANLHMTDINIALIRLIMEQFGITPKVLLAKSDLHLTGHKDERIFNMCEQLHADTYLSGTGAAVYHQPEEYARKNIELVYSEYKPIMYDQMYGPFIENLSVIDYVMNCGFEFPKEWL